MRNKITALFAGFFLLSTHVFGQFRDVNEIAVGDNEIVDPMYRTGRVGIGFAHFNAYNNIVGTNPPRFLVQDGILGHYVSGTVGSFSSGSRWLGLGIGNPGNIPEPYGLAILDSANLGFYNIISEVFGPTTRKNLIAGFGANGANLNRFIVRGYSGTNAATGKDILVANPAGAVGINEEPRSSLWVNARETNTDSVAFRAIAIVGRQRAGNGQVTTASAIGAQQNASLASSNIAVEGFRAQFPDFADAVANIQSSNQTGAATNLQVVNNPLGSTDVIASSSISGNKEYAELTWQDLDFGDGAFVDCDDLDIAVAEGIDKFFISFRNNENTDPFDVGNKLPVMTFQANGRVGIGTLQPTSGTCAPEKQTILLDVNGLIRAAGSLVTSDRRFKQDIETIPNSLELIRKMRGTTYVYKTQDFPDRNFSGGKQYGFIAQELEKVIPEATVLNSDGYYAVNYTMLIPVLTEAMKEQDARIAAQADEIARLNAEMQQLRNLVLDMKTAQTPADLRGYRLEQNTPNPFGNTTQIRYALPAGTAGASINVYDLNGRLLRSYPLTDLEGTVTINGADFPSGAYLYDLIVGGRQVDVKRMVLSKV